MESHSKTKEALDTITSNHNKIKDEDNIILPIENKKEEKSINSNQNKMKSENNTVFSNITKLKSEENIKANPNNIVNEDAKKYFVVDLKEENPKIFNKWTNIRYYNLELIFDSFYPLTSLAIAKNTSKEERIARKIKDKSFTYGEIVFK